MNTLTIHPTSSDTPRKQSRNAGRAIMTTALALFTGFSAQTLSAQVPAVVATTQTSIASGFTAGPAVTDACGDIYVYEGSGTGVVEIQAGTGTVTTVVTNPQGYTSQGQALYMDVAKKNLYFPDFSNFYTTHFDQLPIVNCAPGTLNQTFGNNLANNYYYGTAQDVAGDAAGDVFFVTTANQSNAIYEEVFTAPNTYTSAQILQGWPNNLTHIVADAAGDVFFNDGSANLYELKAPYTTAPTAGAPFATGFSTIVGLSIDAQGNLYVADGGASLIYEIPNESGTLKPADKYALASVGLVAKVGVDAHQNFYLSNYYPGAVEIKVGSGSAPATALGSTSASFGINYVFNQAVTPSSITAVTGTATSTAFSPGTGSCAVGTQQTVHSSCTVNATYTPSAVGEQTGAIVFTSSAPTVITDVSGVGQGAAATIDPGTVVPTTTTLNAPNGVTVDNLGNVYVTDSTANTLTEFAVGSNGVGTTVSTGSMALNAPSAVAVDNVGDIFIANTGANQIVEIPVVNGALETASTLALALTLKNPKGIATDGAGNLYIADTGDNNLLFVPNNSGVLNPAAALSYGASLNGPSSVTVDPSGNVYVTETGNKDLIEFPAPLGSAAQIKVAGGFNDPTSVATDASGSVYVADSGAATILRYPKVGAALGNHTLVGSSLAAPTAVAVDASGNLYATDTTDSIVAEIQRVTAALQFGGVNVLSTSTPLTASVNNSGNESLIFQSPSYIPGGNTAAGFTVTTDGCAGTTGLPGSSCDITATFTPPVNELNAQENLVLASNAQNGTPTLELVGTGAETIASTLSLVLTSPAGAASLNASQSVTFTATAVTAGNTPVPGGIVKFYVNGTQVGSVATTNGAAVLKLTNGLPAGNAVIVSAVYGGTVVGGTQYYNGSSAQLTEDVISLPDSLTLTLTPEYNNPNSSNDNIANAAGPVVPLIATVVPSTATIPTGTVTFYAGTSVLGIKQVVPNATGGYGATLNTTGLRAGTTTQVENDSYITNYNITAVYSGDNTYYPATSNSASISIVGGPAVQPACATATPATCNSNTTGAFFTISPANPTITATTTTAGGPASGSTTLTINSYGGWNGILNFTCSGLPAYATCAPYPGYPNGLPSTPGANVNPTTVDFIINTNVAPTPPTGAGSMVWWVSGIAGMVLLVLRRRVKQMGYLRAGQLFTLLGAVLLLGGSAIGMSGCSTSSYSYITPAGSSTVTVKVSAAQLVPNGSPAGSTYLPDSNTPTFQITLVVK